MRTRIQLTPEELEKLFTEINRIQNEEGFKGTRLKLIQEAQVILPADRQRPNLAYSQVTSLWAGFKQWQHTSPAQPLALRVVLPEGVNCCVKCGFDLRRITLSPESA